MSERGMVYWFLLAGIGLWFSSLDARALTWEEAAQQAETFCSNDLGMDRRWAEKKDCSIVDQGPTPARFRAEFSECGDAGAGYQCWENDYNIWYTTNPPNCDGLDPLRWAITDTPPSGPTCNDHCGYSAPVVTIPIGEQQDAYYESASTGNSCIGGESAQGGDYVPATETETGGETGAGEETETGGETGAGEETETGGETGTGEETETGGETSAGEGTGTGGGTGEGGAGGEGSSMEGSESGSGSGSGVGSGGEGDDQEGAGNVVGGPLDLPDVGELFYQSEYPDGFAGVWEDSRDRVLSSGLLAGLTSFGDAPNSGSYPRLKLDYSALRLGERYIEPPPRFWQMARTIILIFSLFAARKILFGG